MPDLERIQQLTPGTLSQQWYEDGAAVDPGTVTLGITRADGTVLVAAGTATSGITTAPRTYNLTTTHTALLERLTVTWTSTLKGTLVSYVEVAGGFLCALSEIKALFPTAADPGAIRTLAEQRLEKECGQAFVPRYNRETLDGTGGTTLLLRWPNVRTIRSATVNGSDITSSLSVGRYAVNLPGGWTAGYGNVVIGYEHGRDFADEDIRKAVLLAAQETYTTTSGGVVIRREADGQAVTFASPSSSASGFADPLLRSIVRANDLNVGIA